jgi:hypothetical protein
MTAKEKTMKKKRNVLLAVLAAAVVTLALAGCSDQDERVQGAGGAGRSWQEVDYGDMESFKGELVYGDPEWKLRTGSETFLLGLGNPDYLESTGLALEEGMTVTVKGYKTDDEISVVTLTADGREVAFRTEDGAPLWAGRGRAASIDPQLQETNRPGSGSQPAADEPLGGQGPPNGTRGRGRGGSGSTGGSGRWSSQSLQGGARNI